MSNHDDGCTERVISWSIVHIGTGGVLAGVVAAASKHFGGFSIAAVFLAGWIGNALFNSVINAVTDQDE